MRPSRFTRLPGWLALQRDKGRSATIWKLMSLVLAAGLNLQTLCAAVLTTGPVADPSMNGDAVIRWSTDVPTRGRIQLGRQRDQLTQRVEGAVTNHHAIAVKGLLRGQRYFYSVGTARVPLATNSFSVPGPDEGLAPVMPAKGGTPPNSPAIPRTATPRAPPTRETWGHVASLPDHFERHGRDFRAKDPDDYARLAWEFLQHAKNSGLPAKLDGDGVLRVFDPKTRSFAAYHRDGTTKTFFKPESRDYFDRQPGRSINVRNWREK